MGKQDFDAFLDRAAEDAARLDNKDTVQITAMLKYSLIAFAVCAALFAVSVYGLNTARTNAGVGVGWFASAVTGLALAGFAWSAAGIWLDLRRRRRADRLGTQDP